MSLKVKPSESPKHMYLTLIVTYVMTPWWFKAVLRHNYIIEMPYFTCVLFWCFAVRGFTKNVYSGRCQRFLNRKLVGFRWIPRVSPVGLWGYFYYATLCSCCLCACTFFACWALADWLTASLFFKSLWQNWNGKLKNEPT